MATMERYDGPVHARASQFESIFEFLGLPSTTVRALVLEAMFILVLGELLLLDDDMMSVLMLGLGFFATGRNCCVSGLGLHFDAERNHPMVAFDFGGGDHLMGAFGSIVGAGAFGVGTGDRLMGTFGRTVGIDTSTGGGDCSTGLCLTGDVVSPANIQESIGHVLVCLRFFLITVGSMRVGFGAGLDIACGGTKSQKIFGIASKKCVTSARTTQGSCTTPFVGSVLKKTYILAYASYFATAVRVPKGSLAEFWDRSKNILGFGNRRHFDPGRFKSVCTAGAAGNTNFSCEFMFLKLFLHKPT